jgi:ATP-dependent Clp protease ATP-binding subunit ClpC
MEAEIESIKTQKEAAIKKQDYEAAAAMRDKEKHAKDSLDAALAHWRTNREEKRVTVGEDEILQVVSKWTGIPLQRMEQGEAQRLLSLEITMTKSVIGQREAVTALCKALRRSRADLKDPKRPIGTFALLGPTGVGKTMLAKNLAEQMFGDAKALIQLDMSEYMEKHAVSRMIGAPPGYIGFEEGGQLTEKVRRQPYSVVLFDEIEKAHPDAMNMLLQILEEGKLTDSVGRVISFRNTIVLLTSNVGAETIKKQSTMGFSPITDEGTYEKMREKIMDEAKRLFRPEFLNRLDDIIVFRSLTKPDLVEILDLEVRKVADRLKGRNLILQLEDKAKDFLVEKGYDPVYGARPMRRAVERFLEDPLAEEILKGTLVDGDPVHIALEGDKLVFIQKATSEPGTVTSP